MASLVADMNQVNKLPWLVVRRPLQENRSLASFDEILNAIREGLLSIPGVGEGALKEFSGSTKPGRDYAYRPGSGRLEMIKTTIGSSVKQDDRYTYDAAGNPISIQHKSDSQLECFKYDHRFRLVGAWTMTTPNPANCPGSQPSSVGGGPEPYNSKWQYDEIGNMLTASSYSGSAWSTNTYEYPGAGQPRPHAVTGTTTSNSGEFNTVTPSRILDTRNSTGVCPGAACIKLTAGTALTVAVAGQGGLPASGIAAAAINITAVNATQPGNLKVYAAGDSAPTGSILNYATGQAASNAAIAKVGSSGNITLIANGTAGSQVDVIIDVTGYHTQTADGSSFNPVNATRVMDTRAASQTGKCPTYSIQCTTIQAGQQLVVQVSGQNGLPNNDMTAVAANITAVNASSAGNLTVWADGSTKPSTANLNYPATNPKAGFSIVKLPANGRIRIYASQTTDVLVDIQGWFGPTSTSSGSTFTPGTQATVANNVAISAAGTTDVQITGQGGAPNAGITAVAVNITAATPAASGYITAYPQGTTRPATSNVNYVQGQTASNTAIVPVNNGKITLYSTASVNATVTVEGWYTNTATSSTIAYDPTGSRCYQSAAPATGTPNCATPPTGATTYSWDALNRLATVTTGSDTNSNIYDANGARLIRIQTVGGVTTRTLYLDGAEITLGGSPTVKGATRYYTMGGSPIAMRTPTTLSWLGGNGQGSLNISATNGSTTATIRRYLPYGGNRGTTALPTQRGFLGATEDSASGLTYLNARYYDSKLGRFLSVDPIAVATNPQSLNSYSYGFNNPITFKDPTGLYADGISQAGWNYRREKAHKRTTAHGRPHVDERRGLSNGAALAKLDIYYNTKKARAHEAARRTEEHQTWLDSCRAGGATTIVDNGDGTSSCGVWKSGNPVASAIVNVAGGVLMVNPITGTLRGMGGIDLQAHGVDGSSNWTKAGIVLGVVADFGASEAFFRWGSQATSTGARVATKGAPSYANHGSEFLDDAIRSPVTRPDLGNLSTKIQRQMQTRGWTNELIDEAVTGGQSFPAINKLGGANTRATRYVNPTTGQSVVIDNATGEVIQVGGPGFRY